MEGDGAVVGDGFGGGVHACLGTAIARLSVKIAFEEFHQIVPRYARMVPLSPGAVTYSGSDVGALKAWIISLSASSLTVSGSQLAAVRGVAADLAEGSVLLTGSGLSTQAAYSITLTNATFGLTGSSVDATTSIISPEPLEPTDEQWVAPNAERVWRAKNTDRTWS